MVGVPAYYIGHTKGKAKGAAPFLNSNVAPASKVSPKYPYGGVY